MPGHACHDTYRFVLLSLWVISAGVLFPWNAFISAPDYFENFHDYVDPHAVLSKAESKMWSNILTYFTTGFSILNIFGQALILRYGADLSISSRVIWSSVGMFLLMLSVPILSYFRMGHTLAFYLLVGAASLNGFFTAFFQSTVFGLSAMFPPEYTQSAMVGNASAGLTVAALRVFTKLGGGDASSNGAIYMYLAAGWLVISLVCFVLMRRLRFAQKFVDEFAGFKRLHFDADSVTTVASSAVQQVASSYCKPVRTDSSIATPPPPRHPSCNTDIDPHEGLPLLGLGSDGGNEPPASVAAVLRKILPMAGTVLLTLLVTIAVFPGVTSRIPSDLSDGWYTIWLILTFNVGDNVGRVLPSLYKPSRLAVVVLGIARAVFIPLMILCVTIIPSPIWPVVIMIFFSISNGYIAGLSMMYGPEDKTLRPVERGMAGNIMSLMLLLGITFGSFTGLLICNFLPDNSDGSAPSDVPSDAW